MWGELGRLPFPSAVVKTVFGWGLVLFVGRGSGNSPSTSPVPVDKCGKRTAVICSSRSDRPSRDARRGITLVRSAGFRVRCRCDRRTRRLGTSLDLLRGVCGCCCC